MDIAIEMSNDQPTILTDIPPPIMRKQTSEQTCVAVWSAWDVKMVLAFPNPISV
jgi:hypothetical protein